MRNKTAAVEIRGKHFVGEDVLLRHCEIRLGFGLRNVCVLGCSVGTAWAALRTSARYLLLIEAVHFALGPRKAALTVAGLEIRLRAVLHVPRRFERNRNQRDFLTGAGVAVRLRVGSWIALEQVIERAVLLNDDDDVLDFIGAAVNRSGSVCWNSRGRNR